MSEDVILIVEDDVRQRALLSEFLWSNGLKALTAGNCLEAEHICRTHRPDAAILDYELPDGNALGLMTRLKTIDPLLPIVILTGQGSIERAVEAVKLGADQFLTKPVDLVTLNVLLRRSLANHQIRQAQLADKSRVRRIVDPFVGKSSSIQKLAEVA